ncbi:MAG: flagellum-specific ATP synthase FliI, partial [Paracoccus sp. (in: a-proteobacteria)]|nr:flagellum-specific ATP synthase FliI [Paracoccus sp. (in: a-proteobacteria)]
MDKIDAITAQIARLRPVRYFGKVRSIRAGLVSVGGLSQHASIGDRVTFARPAGALGGEIIGLGNDLAHILPEEPPDGLSIDAQAELIFAPALAPDASWIGRIIDPFGRPLDGRPLDAGPVQTGYHAPPPAAVTRKRMGGRLATGLAVFDTLLPIVRGQRVGLFAGSGV